MARTFRRHRQITPISELNLTNLIDLGFTLLIIFMISAPLMNQQEQTIPINLPVESKSTQAKPDPDVQFVAVSIDGRGTYYLQSSPVSFADLQSRLRGYAAQTKQPVIRIRADGTVPYQQVVRLMDVLKQNQLSKITFDTQAPGN